MRKVVVLSGLILALIFILWWQLADLRTAKPSLSSHAAQTEKAVFPESAQQAPQGIEQREEPAQSENKEREEHAPDGVDVLGVVRDEAGNPIGGAEVKALQGIDLDRNVQFLTATAKDGSYSMTGLHLFSASPYQVVASAEGYAQVSSGLFFLNDTPKRIDLTLTKGAPLDGHVMDESRRGIPEAIVELFQGAEGSFVNKTEAKTDADGAFSFKNLSPDSYLLVVSANGFINQRKNVTIDLHESRQTQDFFLEFAGHGYISGIVLDENDDPLEATKIEASQTGVGALSRRDLWHKCSTSADGGFRLEGFVPRRTDGSKAPITFLAKKEGYKQVQTTVYAGDNKILIHLRKNLLGSISGKVVEALEGDSSTPITEFEVEVLSGSSVFASRDFQSPDGEFVFTVIDEGIYDLRVSAPDRAPHFQEFLVVKPGEETSAGLIRLAQGASITGKVTGKDKAEPLPGALVYIKAGNSLRRNLLILTGAYTDESGSYYLEGVPPGSIYVLASYPGYATGVAPKLEVIEGEEFNIDVVLGNGGSLEGKVTDNGVPLSGQIVNIIAVESPDPAGWRTKLTPWIPVQADEKGCYRKDNLMPGFYSCSVYVPAGRANVLGDSNLISDVVEVLEDNTTTLDFNLCGGGSVKGKLMSEIPMPQGASEVQVWLTNEDPADINKSSKNHYIVSTSVGSTYSFDNVCPGKYTISASFVYKLVGGSRSEETPCRLDPPGVVVVEQGKTSQRDVIIGGDW
jgi:protocatechuate 3,4-dioxygenase beta subunit